MMDNNSGQNTPSAPQSPYNEAVAATQPYQNEAPGAPQYVPPVQPQTQGAHGQSAAGHYAPPTSGQPGYHPPQQPGTPPTSPYGGQGPYGYGQPYPYPPPQPFVPRYAPLKPPGRDKSVAALICGAVTFFAMLYYGLGGIPTAIVGIVLGVQARKQSPEGARGMATAGLVLSIIGLVFSVLIVAFMVLAFGLYFTGY